MMSKEVLYLGLDVHAENMAVAIAEVGREREVRNYGVISSSLHSVDKLLHKLGHPGKELRVCYEAGPCGFVLARHLKKKGITCDVIAPSRYSARPASRDQHNHRSESLPPGRSVCF